MADEFKTMIDGFKSYGKNYCANAKKVITDIESRKIIDIYDAGLSGAMEGMSELLNAQYASLPDDGKNVADEFVRLSGVLPMLELANKTVGPNSLNSVAAVSGAAELFPKVKKIIRGVVDIEKGGVLDKILDFLDTIVENIPKLLGLVRG